MTMPNQEAALPELSDAAKWHIDRIRNYHLALTEREDQLRQAISERNLAHGMLAMNVARLGGSVEGKPTDKHNFLQRVDELVEKEKTSLSRIAALESLVREMFNEISDLEWSMDGDCPRCGAHVGSYHKHSCTLRPALDRANEILEAK